jgi:hypothetical protein
LLHNKSTHDPRGHNKLANRCDNRLSIADVLLTLQDPDTGEHAGPGFSGSIPSTLSNAEGLAFVELSSHSLTGDVPALPAGIRMFEAFGNQLDGTIASKHLPAADAVVQVNYLQCAGQLLSSTSWAQHPMAQWSSTT